jgi:hypothetical protein
MNIAVGIKPFFDEASNPSKFLDVRFSTSADLDDVIKFYKDNRHQHVDVRPVDVFEKATSEARMLLLRDSNGTLVASSSAYDFSDTEEMPHKWVEIGSTRSVLNGFGLYPFIIATQVVVETLRRPPGEMFVANIYDDNIAVQNILEHTNGWHKFTPPKELVKVTDLEQDMDRLVWLKSTPESLSQQMNIFKSVLERGFFENKKSGEYLGIKFEMPAFPAAPSLRIT